MTRIFLAFSVVFAFFALWSSGGTLAIYLAPELPFAQNLPSLTTPACAQVDWRGPCLRGQTPHILGYSGAWEQNSLVRVHVNSDHFSPREFHIKIMLL